MKHSLQISHFGGPECLKLISSESNPLSPHTVRVKVKASGVNFADIMMRMGLYPEAPKPPFVPGYEISGTITEIGPQVKSLQVGDRVFGGCRFGGYTTEIVLPESQLRRIPERLSDQEAAGIPVNFLTAWFALMEMARVRKNDRVLIHSAAGGVGTAAVQMAAQVGAQVVGLVGSEGKKAIVRSLGAQEVILNSEWEGCSDSEAGGFDLILDPTGGASLKRSLRRLLPSGRLVNYGASSLVGGERRSLFRLLRFATQTTFFTPFGLMMGNQGVFGLNLLQLFSEAEHPEHPSRLEAALDLLLEKFKDGSYKVILGQTFPLTEGGAAHQTLQSRSNIGKIILTADEALP
ncbi:MAG: alcohol dehydrogenase catalytic domain-containing protein [Bdellovibrionia bacterium]